MVHCFFLFQQRFNVLYDIGCETDEYIHQTHTQIVVYTLLYT